MSEIDNFNPWDGYDRDLRGPPDLRVSGLDAHFKEALSDFSGSEAAVVVVSAGKTAFAKGFSTTGNFDADAAVAVGPAALPVLAAAAAPETLRLSTNLFSHSDALLADLLSQRLGFANSKNASELLWHSLLADLSCDRVAAALPLIPIPPKSCFRGGSRYSPFTAPLVAHSVSRMTQKPFESLILENLLRPIGASPNSGFVSLGREDAALGLSLSARDLARLVSAVLDDWGPFSNPQHKLNLLTPCGVILDEHCVDAFPGECGGFRITNGGWLESIYRGEKRLSFGGYSSTSSFEVCLFPEQKFGVVVTCTRPCHLPKALTNVASDFLLQVSPGPWVPRLQSLPFPFVSSNHRTVNEDPISVAPTPLPRSTNYYVGTYASPVAPHVAFKVTQADGRLIARFLNGHAEALQPSTVMLHVENGLFHFNTQNFLPSHLQYGIPNVNCGIQFENGPAGTVEILHFFPSFNDKSVSIKFEKSVPYTPAGSLASFTPATILTPSPSHSGRNSTVPPPSLPPRRTPESGTLRQTSAASLVPPALPPRSRQSSTTAAATPITAPVHPPPPGIVPPAITPVTVCAHQQGPSLPPPLIPVENKSIIDRAALDKSRDQDVRSGREDSVSPPPRYTDGEQDDVEESLEDVTKDMDAVDDLFKEMGME